jgi:hypothetical protein
MIFSENRFPLFRIMLWTANGGSRHEDARGFSGRSRRHLFVGRQFQQRNSHGRGENHAAGYQEQYPLAAKADGLNCRSGAPRRRFQSQGTFTAGIGAVGRGTKWGWPRTMVESANKVKTAITSPPRILQS